MQIEKNKKIGSALVVGGGIGGMQAALDLADSGIKVYLMDNKSCIGGVMSQLDKTFPTNDCAMCTMAPRLVEIGRHKDIELITLAEVESVKGVPGNFTVTLNRKARFVDEEKCTGCGECVDKCPIEVISDYNTGLSFDKAIYRRYPQAIPPTFAINKLGHSPCRVACPAEQKAQGYIALIREKRFEDAYKVILRDNPFASVCGRVCKHYCEQDCTRAKVDESVSVMNLKRFVADWAYDNKLKIKNEKFPPDADSPMAEKIEKSTKRVAVIGSGPAGLTCAFDLSNMGYRVTVFEAFPQAGGMMRLGIPKFRLPPERLEWDIQNIRRAGFEIKTNSRINSIDRLFHEGYKAVFIATGSDLGKKLHIPGVDSPSVLTGISFLRMVCLGKKLNIGEKVLVLGGGNVAMDVARTAIRLGAKDVRVACLESKDMMPADPWEIEAAEEEGISIYPRHSFLEVISLDRRVKGVKCIKVNFRGFDKKGRPDIDLLKGTEQVMEADTVIFAIGQISEIPFVKEGIELTKSGTIRVDELTLATSKPGVFAGGDVVTGTKFIVDAVSSGHSAARSIERYLKGEELKQPQASLYKVELTDEEIASRVKSRERRKKLAKIGEDERRKSFAEVEKGFTEEEALKEAERCLNCGICSECLECVEACGPKAVEHDMPPETSVDINVGAIILSSGSDIFDPDLKKEYGYSRFPNVITSLQFERILSASGPYAGKVLRPKDMKEPKKIAFIQCVGSRDTETKYCSSVCCMYATKEAIIAKEHSKDLDCTIFFTDIRAFSKGFEDYHKRAVDRGIKYIRCRPSSIKEVPGTGSLRIKYQSDKNEIKEEIFDLVVLSVGIKPVPETKTLAEKLDIWVNEHNFCWSDPFEPAKTNKGGIYALGTFTEPKDIPETVMQASAASSKAVELLLDVRGSLIKPKEYPKEKDLRSEEPRVGVFICHCGKNIAGVVNVSEVRDYVKTLADVVYAEDNLYTCSADTAKKIKEVIEEKKLNRVVVVSCSPRTHEALFQETLKESGLNPYLFEMANIRDQCSWPHMYEPEKATLKAKALVRMSIAKARLLEPLYQQKVKINQNALVVGGGLAGMTASLSFSKYGINVYLIEKEKELGGNLRKLHYELKGGNPQKKLQTLIELVNRNSNIHVYKEAEIKEINGSVGKFKTLISSNGTQEEIEHGVVVVATGAKEYKPKGEYLYGEDEKVLTQLELEEKLANNKLQITNRETQTMVMIQCVGARDQNHPYCNRVCCSHAIKNALKIKEINPEAKIFVLYRDIRTYGFYEPFYQKAREQGVIFIRYEEDSRPNVYKNNGRLKIDVKDATLDTRLLINTDLVVLSTGPIPPRGNEELCKLMKIPLSKDEFFLEKHIKLCPCECATQGIYLCGLAHYSKTAEETIASAEAAAMSAYRIIGRNERELEARTSFVLDENCDGCAYCIEPCPNDAVTLIEYMYQGAIKKTVEVDTSLCEGCGSCMATCPKKGIYVKNFRPDQIMAQVEAAIGLDDAK